MQLIFREGKLTGSEHFAFSNLLQDDEEILASFLLQTYKEVHDLPSEILLAHPIKEEKIISDILSEARNKKVHIYSPQKGEKLLLVKLAEKNAQAAFMQEKDHLEMKEKMLLDLQELLKLNRYPKRIECFDTSNISGADPVASLVAFTDGERDKKRTRLYHIKGMAKGDDYGAMRQALSRRLSRAKQEEDLPDLIIVDGGKGQLGVAMDVFKELDIANVDLIALAKENARHDKGMTLERVFLPHTAEPIRLPARSPTLFFLQKIRDAAHEKAVMFHRKSALDTIPGIGPIKRKKLLSHFGSMKRVLEAEEDELRSLKLSSKDIEAILSYGRKLKNS